MIDSGLSVRATHITGRAIVALRVMPDDGDRAREALMLASPLRRSSGDRYSLWMGPGHWILMSDKASVSKLLNDCRHALGGCLHHAVDVSDGLVGVHLDGSDASELLARATGIDLRPGRLGPSSCVRTRLARIPATIAISVAGGFEIWIDRSYKAWFLSWLRTASVDPGDARE